MKRQKTYALFIDTGFRFDKVDDIAYTTIEDINRAIKEYKRIDKINGKSNDYVVWEYNYDGKAIRLLP